MKNKLLSLFLGSISLSFCLNACKDSAVATKTTESDTQIKIKKESVTKLQLEQKTEPLRKFSSRLRPNEKLEIGEIYTDTINFLGFNTDYDDWLFAAKKNNDTIYLIYNEGLKTKLFEKDELVVNWKMDSLRYAADTEYVQYREYLVSFKKKKSAKLIDEKAKVLWRKIQYDEEIKDSINTMVLNNDYIKTISEPEKAALAYIATFIGNECFWEGEVNENRSNLKCEILSALKLGYQCSDTHLGFLRKWFSKDTIVLKKLKSCPTIPFTATIQTTFDEISIATNVENETISVSYKVYGVNIRESRKWSWTQTDNFEYNSENITLINSQKSEVIEEDIEISEK